MTPGSGAWECMVVVGVEGGFTALGSAPEEHSGLNPGQLCWLRSASVKSTLVPGG